MLTLITMCQATVLKVLSTLCYLFSQQPNKARTVMMACRGEDLSLRLYDVWWGWGAGCGKQTHHQPCLPL